MYGYREKKWDFLPDEIPNEKLNEDWAIRVHSQTLKRLNERGGMTVTELLMNLRGMTLHDYFMKYGYNYVTTESDAKELLTLLTTLNP